jgi:hypothetical protein
MVLSRDIEADAIPKGLTEETVPFDFIQEK